MFLKLYYVDKWEIKTSTKISVYDATAGKQSPSPIYQSNLNSKRDKKMCHYNVI